MPSSRSLLPSIGLADVFRQEAIVVGLVQRTKQGAVEELVHQLATLGEIPAAEGAAIVSSIMARERLQGSTGLNGIAYPHCRVSCVDRFVGAIGLAPQGLPFDAVDGDPVGAVFLLLAPLDRREQLFQLLGRVAALGRDKTQRLQLCSCPSSAALHHFLQTLDRP